MTLLPIDNNGNPIDALTPRIAVDVTLSSTVSEVLAPDSQRNRIVRLFPTSDGVKIGMGSSPSATFILTSGVGEYFQLEAGATLYGAGSGTLNIGVME